jgi:teichuronic acid biosynthesis glycosyltransferase TuaC
MSTTGLFALPCSELGAGTNLRVLMITSEWPTAELPNSGPFIRQQAELLSSAGVSVDVFRFRGARNPLNYLRAWRQVRNKLSQHSYDLVHAQFGHSGLLALPKQLPLVVTFRGSDLEGIVGSTGGYTFFGRILQIISRRVARIADQVIVVSESLVGHLPNRTYHLIPSGLDLELFKPLPQESARKQLGLPANKRLILFAADPGNPRKRFALAQSAAARLAGRLDVELVVASGVPRAKIPIYMGACDVLLLTSLHEGSPNVVKEALACNLPVVSVDVGDVSQRIAGVAGCVLCSDDQPQTIAAGLASVLTERRRIDGRTVIANLDERILSKSVISVYEQAVSRA